MTPSLVTAFHSTTDANPQVISLSGKANGHDLLALFTTTADPTLPTNWVEDGSFVAAGGAFVTKLWRLPAAFNTSSVTTLSISLSASRAVSAVIWEDDLNSTPGLVFELIEQSPNGATPALWGTGLHTFTTRDVVFAVFGISNPSVDISGFDLASYDHSFTDFADTTVAQATAQQRLWVASHGSLALTSDGVTATANTAAPGGSWKPYTGIIAYNTGAPPPAEPVLDRSPASLEFAFELGGTAPAAQNVTIINAGTAGTVNWSASDDAAWLSESPTSGTANSTMAVTADPSGLDVGEYTGTITITAPVTGSPKTVAVTLTVNPQQLTAANTDEFQMYRKHSGGWRKLLPRVEGSTTPEAHGARGDCVTLTDVAMTAGSPNLDSASAPFTVADVDKWVSVRGAGDATYGGSLTGQIVDVPSAGRAVLDVNAAANVSDQVATYGTDDTVPWGQAIQSLVDDGIANGTYFGKLLIPPRQYMIAGDPTVGGSTLGNAQIPLPVISSSDQKFVLVLQGAGDASGLYHWRQQRPHASGSVLRTCRVNEPASLTYGPASVLGGPTVMSSEPDGSSPFSNMLVYLDGLTVIAPRNPSLLGVDLGRVAQANIGTLSIVADAVPGGGAGGLNGSATSDKGMALRMPHFQNNDNTNVFSYGCEGFYYGIEIADHFTCQRIALIYCHTAIYCNPPGVPQHGAHIGYASVEACTNGIESGGSSGARYPLSVARIDIEVSGGTTVIDPNNTLYGEMHYAHNSALVPSRTGAANLRIVDSNRARGAFTAPTVPASGVAVSDANMPWRDAQVVISGGTVTAITVDGQTMFTNTTQDRVVMVPTGKTISVTYSVAPTWKWTLL